jgi:hypothetical protein
LGTATLWTGFAIVCVRMLIAALDVEPVTTFLPTIQKSLGMTLIR